MGALIFKMTAKQFVDVSEEKVRKCDEKKMQLRKALKMQTSPGLTLLEGKI